MSNPVFNNSDVFGPQAGRGRATAAPPAYGSAPAYGTPARPGPQDAVGYGAVGAQTADAATLDAWYQAPSATTADTKRLSYDDVIVKTGGLLALLVAVGAVTWVVAPGLFFIGAIVGLVLGLINSFKRNPSPALIIAYTVAEGVFLGGISKFYQDLYSGAVPTAVVATIATFAATLFLFKSGRVRVTAKFTRWLLIAMTGYLVFSLLNIVLLMFGALDGWGLRGGPIGIVIGLFAVGLAAASLLVDFDAIKRGVEGGVPAKFAWSAAFGLLVTLIWLYLEFLRLIAIFSRN